MKNKKLLYSSCRPPGCRCFELYQKDRSLLIIETAVEGVTLSVDIDKISSIEEVKKFINKSSDILLKDKELLNYISDIVINKAK